MTASFTYNQTEKLKSRKVLTAVFTSGKSFSVFPVKVFYMMMPEKKDQFLKVGVGVSAKHFKKAVDRNRIKRLLREGYRLNKTALSDAVEKKQQPLAVFFLYIGKELPEYALLNEKMIQAITKLENIVTKSST